MSVEVKSHKAKPKGESAFVVPDHLPPPPPDDLGVRARSVRQRAGKASNYVAAMARVAPQNVTLLERGGWRYLPRTSLDRLLDVYRGLEAELLTKE